MARVELGSESYDSDFRLSGKPAAALDFSINTLSLLGLVLAAGLVVDDAIVVVENVQRRIQEGGTDLKEITKAAMREVRGPILATTLALMAVFIPVAFIPGPTGKLYNQFALTIAIAVALSGINSLTLSPALCAVFLRPTPPTRNPLFRAFNSLFEKMARGYQHSVKHLARVWYLVLLLPVIRISPAVLGKTISPVNPV